MCPTLLHLVEFRVNPRVIARNKPREGRRVQYLLMSCCILVDSMKQDSSLFVYKSPNAANTPTRLVNMHDHRVSYQRAKVVEFASKCLDS